MIDRQIDLAKASELTNELTSAQMTNIKANMPSSTANVNIDSMEIYSPNERQVGYWQEEIDGVLKQKPVWEVTLVYNGSSSVTINNSPVTLSGITDVYMNNIQQDIDVIIEMKKTSYRASQRDTLNFMYNFSFDIANGKVGASDDVNSKWLNITFMPNEGITLRYTKTTDEWEVVE